MMEQKGNATVTVSIDNVSKVNNKMNPSSAYLVKFTQCWLLRTPQKALNWSSEGTSQGGWHMLRAARHKISYDGWVLLSVSQPIWNFAQGQCGGCFIETHGFTSSLTLTARTRWHSDTWGPCFLGNEPQDGGRPSEEMAIARHTQRLTLGSDRSTMAKLESDFHHRGG